MSFNFGQQNTQTSTAGFNFGASANAPLNLTSTPFQTSTLGTSTSFGATAQNTASTAFGIAAPSTGTAFGATAPGTGTAFGAAAPGTGTAFGAVAQGTGTAFGTAAPGTGTAFGAAAPGTGAAFGIPAATTTSLFGTTQAAPAFSSSLFPTTTTTSSAFSSTGTSGFTFGGGFGSTTSSTAPFGASSLLTTTSAPVTSATSVVGLGGVDVQVTSGLDGGNAANKKDGKTVKENQVPNEILSSLETFKKYVKEQKEFREEVSRTSSKDIFKIQEQVATLRQLLSTVCNGVHRNAIAIAKLKDASNQELKNAEIGQRTRDSMSSLQYENTAPREYFHNVANSFEKQMHTFRQQIEQLERHLVSMAQPYTFTPAEYINIRKRLHETFVTLAAQLQTVHQEIQQFKENFINQRMNPNDVRSAFHRRKEMAIPSHLPAETYGPSPFAALQSSVGKAITNAFSQSHQICCGSGTFVSGSVTLGVLSFDHNTTNKNSMLMGLPANRTGLFQTSSNLKPLGQTTLPAFGGSTFGSVVGFGSAATSDSQFGIDSQKTFQLQKPPAGNKRGKRWTST